MTSIEKLCIQGIRSFSPNDKCSISFLKPLTIIVGPNGSGKTTIIECLKYACTGELPPNSSNGQAFIHDTKVYGDAEIKAQIRLLFRTVDDRKVMCVRTLQLTQKATTQKFAALDATLVTFNDTGERVTQSMRCAEINSELPELMGVSKAILEDVIFCHQEDSNWPLEAPAAVKKHFDNIFASTRYTKALESIKVTKTEKATELRVLRTELPHLEKAKADVAKLRSDLENCEDKIRSAERQISELMAASADLQPVVASLRDRLRGVQKAHERVAELRRNVQSTEQAVTRALEQLEVERSETDEELRLERSRLMQAGQHRASNRADLDAKTAQLKAEISKLQASIDQANRSHGKLLAEAEKHAAQMRDCDKLMEQLATAHNLTAALKEARETAGSIDESVHMLFISCFSRVIDQSKAQISAMKRKNDERMSSENARLSELTTKLGGLQSSVKAKQEQQAALDQEKDSLAAQLRRMPVAPSQLEAVEEQLEQAEAALKTMQSRGEVSKLQAEIEQAKQKKRHLDSEHQKLLDELQQTATVSDARLRVDDKARQLAKKEEQANRLLAQHSAALNEQLQDWTVKTVVQAVQEELELRRGELKDKERVHREEEKRHMALELSVKEAKRALAEMEAAQATRRGRIEALCGAEPYEQKLHDAEEQLKRRKDVTLSVQAMEKTFERFRQEAAEDHRCPICERGLKPEEEPEFQERLQDRIRNVPEKIRKFQAELRDLEARVAELRALESDNKEYERAALTLIPAAKAKIDQDSASLAAASHSIKGKAERLASARDSIEKLQSLLRVAEEIHAVHVEKTELARALENERSRLPLSQVRSKDDILQDQKRVREELDQAAERLEKKQNDHIAAHEKLREKEAEISRLKRSLQELMDSQRQRVSAEQRLKKLSAEKSAISTDIERLVEDLQATEERISDLRRQQEQSQRDYERTEQQARQEHNRRAADLHKFETLHADVELYRQQSKEREFLDNQAKIEALRTAISQKEAEVERVAREAERISSDGLKHQQALQVVNMNLEYRERYAELGRLHTELQRETAALQSLPKIAELEAEVKSKEYEVREKAELCSRIQGEVSVHVQRRKEITEILGRKDTKTAETKFRMMEVKAKTMEMAIADLDKYHTALDQALMQYHHQKMTEINKSIKELWQNTYRGSDIDTIEIRADSETTSRSSYNYRVVMIKGDTAIDMRGRCSAGQKVLACLIIRLALAENFCINCGILALDEPTTNLDEANIRSLAASLNDIISVRRGQANFSLIVITHDEDFVATLGRSDHADFYYRVSKNEHGYSVIEQQNMIGM